MYKAILLLFIVTTLSFGFEAKTFSTKFSGKKIDKKISSSNTYQNNAKPDIVIEDITTYLQRDSTIGSFNGPMYINEPLELDVSVKNIFTENGHTKKKFKIKYSLDMDTQVRYMKRKLLWFENTLSLEKR